MLPSFKIQSLSVSEQTAVPFTFGQVFAASDFLPGGGLMARGSDGRFMPLQVDVKASHPDGSVRHAIISGRLGRLGAGATLSFDLRDSEKGSSNSTQASVTCSVKLTLAGVEYFASIDASTYLADTWLSGAIVNESRGKVIFTRSDGIPHPHLVARFGTRNYEDRARIEVVVENVWAYEPGPQNFTYDVSVTVGGAVVFEQKALTHYHHARWRKTFWTGATPQINVQLDTAYLIATKAVPNYDTSVLPAASVLAQFAALSMNSSPMSIGLATAYMPSTGAHPDIGILPSWQAAYVLSMDSRARDATMVTADGAGSWSVHYRDRKTDRPVTLTDHPRMTIVGRSTDAGADAFPGVSDMTPYTHDIAHQPSLAYLAELVTGEYYYLEEMQFWAMYDAFASNPGYRGAEKGLVQPEQLRGQAWALRTLAQAAYLTPDADPLKSELNRIVGCNLDWYNATYSDNPNANKIGVITNGYAIDYNNQTAMAPWMDDFFTSTVGYMLDLGFEKARPLLEWKAKFTLGRMLDACWIPAASYGMTVRDTSSSPIYDTIAQCYTHDLGSEFMALPCASLEMAKVWNTKGYPNNMYPSDGAYARDMGNIAFGNLGYPSNMQPALAYLVSHGVPRAAEAWALFDSRSVKPDYSTAGQFNIIPLKIAVTQPTPEEPTMTFKITIDGFDSAVQQLPAGSESSLSSIRVRIMSPAGAVLGESSTLPYSLGGLEAGVYPVEIAALDSAGAVMGTPATDSVDTASAPVVVPPEPVSVSLPSAIRASVVQEV